MYFNVSALDWRSTYKLLSATIVPRPIAWVVTRNPDSSLNAAPFSFFNYFSGSPPVVCIGMTDLANGPPDSFVNIRRTEEFVINLVSEELAQAMNVTAIEFPRGASEIEMAGLRTIPSTQIATPRIEGSPVALECRLAQVLDVFDGRGRILLAHVVAMHISDEAVIDAQRCHVDTARLALVGRMESPGVYIHTTDRFSMRTPGFAEWSAQRSAGSPLTHQGDKP